MRALGSARSLAALRLRLGRETAVGVVEPERLNVHGVKGLKVADLSICPDNVGCNTYSTALLIGEKCSMWCQGFLSLRGALGRSPRRPCCR